jgi:hypothetical protein
MLLPFWTNGTRYPSLPLRNSAVQEEAMGKGILLWLLGIPIPIIILILIFWH